MDKPTSIRFLAEEKKEILKAAKKEGRTLTGYVRFHIMSKVRDQKMGVKR